MDQKSGLAPEEKDFLSNQARRLQSSGQSCKLVTTTEHSVLSGRVVEAAAGGIAFETQLERVFVPWSNVGEIIEPTSQASRGAAAGGGSSSGSGEYAPGQQY